MTSKASKLRLKRKQRVGRLTKEGTLPEPGRRRLPEDFGWISNRSTLKQQPERTSAPKVVSSCRVPRSDVERRLLTAMKTIRALPDRERRFFIIKSTSPDYIHEYMDAYNSVEELVPKFKPSPADVDDCLVALSWIRHLPKKSWQILWWRSFELSYGLIARYIGRSDETARKRFEEAITDAWAAANGV